MKEIFVRDLAQHQNKTIRSTFLVRQKELRSTRNGEPYLALRLGDASGEVEARMWENASRADQEFALDDLIEVTARVELFRQRPQISIQKLRRLDETPAPKDYYPASKYDSEEMFQKLGTVVEGFSDPHLKGLLQAVLGDAEIAARLKRAPAAKSLHHAYLGGLLEHVLSLCRLCYVVAKNYPQVRRDLLLTGAILHDLGKIYELEYERSFQYSTPGQLLGHMIIGLEMVQKKMRALEGFPPELKTLVEHLIISHHGAYEFGSPKLPMFPEALMLHYLDDLDSKMESMRATLERDQAGEGSWTSRCYSLDRALLKVDQWLSAEEAPAEPAAPNPGQGDS